MPETQTLLWFLKTSGLFNEAGEQTLNSVIERTRSVEFARGEALEPSAVTNPSIYLLREGQVKLRSTTEAGKEIITDIAGPGDVIGPLSETIHRKSNGDSLTSRQGLVSEAIAMSQGSAEKLSITEFSQIVDRHPSVVIGVSRLLGIKQQRMTIRLNRLLYRSSLGKLAGLLAELAERYGDPAANGLQINIRLTHQDMASMIGVKRETVSEGMAELEYQEIIEVERRRITVCKLEKLDEII